MTNQFLTKPEAIEEHRIQQDELNTFRYSEDERYRDLPSDGQEEIYGYYDHSRTNDKYLKVELTAFDPDNDKAHWFTNYQQATTCAEYSSDPKHGGWIGVSIFSTNDKPLAALSKEL